MPRRSADATKVAAQITAYFAKATPDARRALEVFRDAIRDGARGAYEVFSYGMPGFKLGGQPVFWYAAWKHHTSLYPMTPSIRAALGDALDDYDVEKGTIRFPLTKPVPTALVKRLVEARVAEVAPVGEPVPVRNRRAARP